MKMRMRLMMIMIRMRTAVMVLMMTMIVILFLLVLVLINYHSLTNADYEDNILPIKTTTETSLLQRMIARVSQATTSIPMPSSIAL